MAMISLSGGFSILPEGWYVFRIKTVEYKEDFGKLHIVLETSEGKTLFNDYNFGADGANQKALNAFSFFARTAMGNASIDKIDPEDLIGKYIRGEVIHTEGSQMDNEGNPKKYANGKNWEYAEGFAGSTEVDLDALLDM